MVCPSEVLAAVVKAQMELGQQDVLRAMKAKKRDRPTKVLRQTTQKAKSANG